MILAAKTYHCSIFIDFDDSIPDRNDELSYVNLSIPNLLFFHLIYFFLWWGTNRVQATAIA